MATLDWNVRRSEGITLVELVVTSETTQRVRIDSALTPVWPPRRQGVPIPGWDESTFEGIVEADAPLVVGYASPAEPVEPPATVTGGAGEDETASPRTLVRALGDAAPPRDAVPAGEQATTKPDENAVQTATSSRAPETEGVDGPGQFEWGPDRRESGDSRTATGDDRRGTDGTVTIDPEPPGTAESPEESPTDDTAAVEKSLERLEQRLSTLEQRLDAVEASTAGVQSK